MRAHAHSCTHALACTHSLAHTRFYDRTMRSAKQRRAAADGQRLCAHAVRAARTCAGTRPHPRWELLTHRTGPCGTGWGSAAHVAQCRALPQGFGWAAQRRAVRRQCVLRAVTYRRQCAADVRTLPTHVPAALASVLMQCRSLRSPPPQLHLCWAHPRHFCAATGLTPPTSAPGPCLAVSAHSPAASQQPGEGAGSQVKCPDTGL